ncbi:low temperature requirement protein A [Deinococcus roseus]|uniref:Low temperature requirement protein A n=1 Tax=Deinococcus roseus TaxID=392414 RepID=A0ABQ2D0G2_9DEIO|nr:low temperature requirement protein A [Deinococcus roseus]GGJ34448.1 hypothetical protein GCM10008938_20810 [Deinococcus roseus]
MLKNYRLWWHAPKLRHLGGEEERKVSWLELFFDLVFVVIISRLAHHFGEHPSWAGLGELALLFIPVWWIWIAGTVYTDRFETEDLSYRVLMFVMLLIVGVMAVFAPYGLGKYADAYAWSYVAARILIIGMWLRAGRHNPIARPMTTKFALGFGASAILWAISTQVDGSLSILLKGIGLVFDTLTPVWTIKDQAKLPRLSGHKMPERFGLLVLIVLGESIVGMVNGLADAHDLNLTVFMRYLLGALVCFGLWWVYFDFIGRRRPNRAHISLSLTWSYSHLPFLIFAVSIGALIAHAIGTEHPEPITLTLLCVGYAGAMLSMALIEYTMAPEHPPVVHAGTSIGLKIGLAALALLTGLLVSTPIGVLAVLCVLNLVVMLYGVIWWFRSPHSQPGHAHH